MTNEIKWLKEKIGKKKVYGIPKGGLIVAGLAGLNIVETPEEAEIIVDDLIDSGETIKKYIGKKEIYVLYVKPHSPYRDKINYFKEEEGWVEFWWEDKEKDQKDLVIRELEYIGENPKREGLLDTPNRVIKSWNKLYEGYKTNPDDILTVFTNESKIDQIVGLSNIEFYSTCEHHLLPFFGKAHIYYIPNKKGKIVGISKLARIVDIYARRLQNQERLSKQIADLIEEKLEPKGTAVILEAQHFCMKARGVEKENAIMKTSDLRGAFRKNEKARMELFQLI